MPDYVADIPTPAVLVDATRLAANLEAMQAQADREGVRLRPHTKTHKSIAIAQQQRDLGALGPDGRKNGRSRDVCQGGV